MAHRDSQMQDFLILGGEMRPDVCPESEWQHFQKGVVVKVDADTLTAERIYDYQSPPEVCPDLPSVVFKAGTLVEDRLYACTQTEVFVYRLPDFTVEHYFSLPFFNDLHHVMPSGRDTLLVVVTGLDLVVEVDLNGELVNEWCVLGDDTWQRFSKDTDYRKVPSTKPHQAHPNLVFTLGDEVWATRCDLKDAVSLTQPGRRIDLSGDGAHQVAHVHDGFQLDDSLYFTSVDGNVITVDIDSLQVINIVNLQEIVKTEYPLGWCRGIKVLDHSRIIIGFSRLRQTKLQDKVSWAKAQVKRVTGIGDYRETLPEMPTRICCFNIEKGEQEWELPLDDVRMDAVFSVL